MGLVKVKNCNILMGFKFMPLTYNACMTYFVKFEINGSNYLVEEENNVTYKTIKHKGITAVKNNKID